MELKKIQSLYKKDEPIFFEDIIELLKDYSRSRVYQLINEAIENNELLRYDTGIYYIPEITDFGYSIPSFSSVIDKKYITKNGEVFGIYGKNVIDYNFNVTTQVPNKIEIITNNESRKIREVKIRNRTVVVRKSRVLINKYNKDAYTLLELFNNLNLSIYKENEDVRNSVSSFIKKNNIKKEMLLEVASYFPAKTIKNLTLSGVLYEIK